MNEATKDTPAVDPLMLELMRRHRGGDCLAEMSEKLREISKAALLTGKSASVTLKIKVSPMGRIVGAMEYSDEIKVTLPQVTKPGTMFYTNSEGALLRDDPNQQHLDLHQVTGGQQDGAVVLQRV